MKKLLTLLETLMAWGAGRSLDQRVRTIDANTSSIPFRMNAGFPGDPTRTHPFSIYPYMNDAAAGSPADAYGQPVVVNAAGNAMRKLVAGDASDANAVKIRGVTVRPFPASPGSSFSSLSTQGFGTGSPAAAQPMSVGVDLSIMGLLNVPADGAAIKIGDPVYVWCAATAGAHIQGGLEAGASAGNTVKVSNAVFNGPSDPSGNVELIVTQ